MNQTEEAASGTLNDNEDVQDSSTSKPRSKNSSTMYVVLREVFFMFAIVFTAYATFLNSQTKPRRGSQALPFFHHEAVRDFYKGDLAQIMYEITLEDFAFVMFYAPWDADSQDVKNEFIKASEFYSNRVYFAAVNCWEPGGECRTMFKDVVYQFPQLVAYLGPNKAVEYKGPQTADHMIRFLHSIMNPIRRINKIEDLWHLRYFHEAVLVGHLQFRGTFGGLGYRLLYDTSLRLASRDPERHTIVGVFTNTEVNKKLKLGETPTIVLYLWNRAIEYSGPLKIDSLISWVLSHTNTGLAEINSNTLLPHMKGGALMVMFTPRHPLAILNPYYQLLRRIAMNFNYCQNGTSYSNDAFPPFFNYYGLHSFNEAMLEREKSFREDCAKMNRAQRHRNSVCSVVVATTYDNMTCYNQQNYCHRNEPRLVSRNSRHDYMDNSLHDKTILERDSERLSRLAWEDFCKILERAPTTLSPKPTTDSPSIPTSCETNVTMSFIALDSQRYNHLANGLGIRLKQVRHRTAVVIIDNDEILKLDSNEVNEEAVANLLRRYLAGERERSVRSTGDTVNFFTKQYKIVEDGPGSEIVVLDSHNFHSVALNDSQNVVVLYHSLYCSFCRRASNIFLSIAHFLKDVRGITFARIDGEMNDLAWQYTVQSYPSIIFFPTARKSESRIFPHKFPVTFHSLSSFILSNLRPYERVTPVLALCSQWGPNPSSSEQGVACLQDVRITSMDVISLVLKEYRATSLRLKHSANRQQEKQLTIHLRLLLKRLEYLKMSHLHLSRVVEIKSSVSYLENLKQTIIGS